MSRWTPCKRRDFIKKLREIGFNGPYSGTRHQFMLFGNYRLAIPNNSEYSVPQLKMMIREMEEIMNRKISMDEWNNLFTYQKNKLFLKKFGFIFILPLYIKSKINLKF